MLHILLTILKVIGIILLVILALIIALILIVLFVPVRYRVHVRKEDSPLEAEGIFTWLLKLLRVEVRYRNKKGRADIKVLFFTIKSIRIPAGEGHPQEKPHTGESSGKKEPAKAAAPKKPEEEPVKKPVSDESKKASSEGLAKTSSAVPERPESEKSGKSSVIPDKISHNEVNKTSSPKEEDRTTSLKEEEGISTSKDEGARKEGRISSVIRSVLSILPDKITKVVEKICDILLRLLDLPFDIYDKADDEIDRIDKKIRAIQYKAEPFLTIEGEHMLRKMIGYVLYLIRGWKPRRIRGYIDFGTGQPDVTGKLTGLIYLLLPDEAEEFDIRPDFYEKRFRTDVLMTGHIRLYRVAVVAVKVLVDREFWELLRMIRHKPPKRKKKRRARKAN